MLSYDEFKDVVTEKFPEYFPEEYRNYEMDVHTVYRTNEILDGISFRRPDQAIAPTVYIQDMYRDYRSCNNLDDVMQRTAETYVEKTQSADMDISLFDQVPTDRIYMTLINAADNAELLADSPHREFQDLAITYRILVSRNDAGMMSTRINSGLAARYNLTEPDLYAIAYENTERLFPSVVCPMNDILRALMESDNYSDAMIDEVLEDNNLYVVTNNQQISGATAVLYEENLQQIADTYGCDLYVIPSSIHEMLVLPEADTSAGFIDQLAEIVCEVNKTAVKESDRLSNQVYKYDNKARELSIVSNSPDQIKDQKREPVKMPGRTR